MGFFSHLFKGRTEPTDGWAVVPGPSPQASLERQALETFGARVRFGDPLAAAAFLGKPDRFGGTAEGRATLTYLAWGLELSFEQGKLAEAFFKIGEGYREAIPDGVLATPRGPDGHELSSRTTLDQLLARYGEPQRRQDLDGETILYYTAGPLISEFACDEQGRLTGWTVYVD